MSEAAAYKAEHDAPENEQGSFNSCSYTLGARSATLDHFGYYPLTRQRPTLLIRIWTVHTIRRIAFEYLSMTKYLSYVIG